MSDLAHIFPPASLLGRVLRWPLKLAPRGRAVPVLLGPGRGLRWVVGVGLHGCWLGTYEWRKQQRFSRMIARGAVVFDIGANTGFYTLIAARRAGRRGVVHAFEPNPHNLAALREHVRLNHFNQVTVHPLALADTSGEMAFDDAGSFTGRLTTSGRLNVAVKTLDQCVRDRELPPPTVMKIDVEGAELAVLRGGRELFVNQRPTLFLATHGGEVHAACCRLLAEWGYRLESLDPGRPLTATDELVAFGGHR